MHLKFYRVAIVRNSEERIIMHKIIKYCSEKSFTNNVSIFAAKNGIALLDKALDMSPFCGTYFMFYVPINILLEMHKLFAIIFFGLREK